MRLSFPSIARHFMAAAASVVLLCSGCAKEEAVPTANAAPPQASSALPADQRLAVLYQQSCRTCHSTGAGGAPIVGDRAAWDVRWAKGAETLRSSTIRGLNGMPPGGQCFACTPEDYDALIRFMAGSPE
ncbi:cytochrome c5 [Povalibacter uvarum]|uniref:Cytochrome c5 n=1 Tax=Povalibacter uvarum TaxID=732238 RepID=A0A841HHK1_9GAMM|nr:c-type cytochrome [Povalibacter uvarum]MBB6092447.1 cytochrome c5 [Povalibacter uvarum]